MVWAATLLSITAMVAVYYLLPLDHSPAWAAVTILVTGLAVFTLVTPPSPVDHPVPVPGLSARSAAPASPQTSPATTRPAHATNHHKLTGLSPLTGEDWHSPLALFG
jgi:hypothetical protein